MWQLITACLVAILCACASHDDPGPLAGTWRLDGAGGMLMQFRKGETEALGMIEKVSYEIKGNDVIVTSENGPMKGVAARYTITGPGTADSGAGLLRKVR